MISLYRCLLGFIIGLRYNGVYFDFKSTGFIKENGMIKESFQNLSKFEKRIGYSFVDKNLIKEVLTHSSLKMTNVKYNDA